MAGKKQGEAKGFGGGSGPDGQADGGQDKVRPDAMKAVKAAEKAQGKVNVVYGPHDIDMDLAGLSIEEVQLALRDVLSVEGDAEAYVDGSLVADKTFKLKSGQKLEFMKEAGQKGC